LGEGVLGDLTTKGTNGEEESGTSADVEPRVVELFGLSEVGLVRESNEDSCLVVDLDSGEELGFEHPQRVCGSRGPLLIVCDGMGGSVAGEIASKVASQAIANRMRESAETSEREILARHLRAAVRQANQEVAAAAAADKSRKGMGTTASVAAIVGNTAVFAQVGDSRAYVLRDEKIAQITRDQSVVSALVHSGRLTKERAPYSMQRGRVLQALGTNEDVEVSLSIAELCEGDKILLCSDGLHEFVKDERIAEVCRESSIEEAVTTLIADANQAGGSDNITVLLAEVRGGGLEAPGQGENELGFTELDPSLEGTMALSTTSIVGRRLAHRAGISQRAFPLVVPATSQHPVVSEADIGPAEKTLTQRSKIGFAGWALIACVGVAALWFALQWL
jgi:protein phosphatase